MGVHGVRSPIYGKSIPRNGFIIIEEEDQDRDGNCLWFDWMRGCEIGDFLFILIESHCSILNWFTLSSNCSSPQIHCPVDTKLNCSRICVNSHLQACTLSDSTPNSQQNV